MLVSFGFSGFAPREMKAATAIRPGFVVTLAIVLGLTGGVLAFRLASNREGEGATNSEQPSPLESLISRGLPRLVQCGLLRTRSRGPGRRPALGTALS